LLTVEYKKYRENRRIFAKLFIKERGSAESQERAIMWITPHNPVEKWLTKKKSGKGNSDWVQTFIFAV